MLTPPVAQKPCLTDGRNRCADLAAPAPARPSDTRCSGSDLMRWAGLPELADAGTDAQVFFKRRIRGGKTLVHEGSPYANLYFVLAGSFKHLQTDGEGGEQVLGFALRGDVIGLEGLTAGSHNQDAMALEDAMVVVLPFHLRGQHHPGSHAIEQLVLQALAHQLMRQHEAMQLMATAGAEARVARFLLHMAARQAGLGYSSRRLRLPMTRRDIASSLGVAHETVSRALAALTDWGWIRVAHRDIEICDAAALQGLHHPGRRPSGVHRQPSNRLPHRPPASAPAGGGVHLMAA